VFWPLRIDVSGAPCCELWQTQAPVSLIYAVDSVPNFVSLGQSRAFTDVAFSCSFSFRCWSCGRLAVGSSVICSLGLLVRSTVRQTGRPYTSSTVASTASRRLARLEREADTRSSDAVAQAAYLRELNAVSPEAVLRRVDRGRHAVGEPVAKEYIKALVATGRFDRTRLPQVLQRTAGEVPASAVAAEAPAVSTASAGYEAERAAASPFGGVAPETSGFASGRVGGFGMASAAAPSMSSWSTNILGAGGAGGAGGVGGVGGAGGAASVNPAVAAASAAGEPVNVRLAEPSMATQAWRTFRSLGTTFLLLAGVGAFMEDRGVGRGVGVNTNVQPESTKDGAASKRFSDVKGCDEAKAELEEMVEYLRSPKTFTRLGGRLPKGVLLTGPPGTGKTLLARAIAGEAGVPFFYASGSEFEEMFVGVGARRVRELFAAAKRSSPCIVFIDEIDAIGGKRNPKDQQYMKMTLNQLLVELDGFTPTDGIIVIGATNFPESLDKALVRPGRFDRNVVVQPPDVRGRGEILQLHTSHMPLGPDVKLDVLARGTPGFTGAELANLANIAALQAALDGCKEVAHRHFEFAKDKILMGAERRSAEISPENRRLTAYHEGGHALVATYTPGADPVHKATVVPRGRALGMVMQLPERDTTSLSRRQMLARLDVMMAGRAAEALVFGEDHVTSGASSDFEQATRLAEAMVTRYGMSDKLGKAAYDKAEESSATRAVINAETKALLDASYARAEALLGEKVGELHALAGSLLEHETLTGEEVRLAATGTLRKAPPVAPVRVPATGGAAGVSSGSGPPRGAPVPAGLPASTRMATGSTRRDATPAASAAPVSGVSRRPLQPAEDVPAAAVAVAATSPSGTPADAPRVAVVVPPSGGSLEAAAAVAAAAVAAASGKAEAAEGKSLSEGFKTGAGRPARDPVAAGRD